MLAQYRPMNTTAFIEESTLMLMLRARSCLKLARCCKHDESSYSWFGARPTAFLSAKMKTKSYTVLEGVTASKRHSFNHP